MKAQILTFIWFSVLKPEILIALIRVGLTCVPKRPPQTYKGWNTIEVFIHMARQTESSSLVDNFLPHRISENLHFHLCFLHRRGPYHSHSASRKGRVWKRHTCFLKVRAKRRHTAPLPTFHRQELVSRKGGVHCVPRKKRSPGFIKELAIAARQNGTSF